MTHGYDLGLKNLFSHPEMLISLIKTFIPENGTDELNFSSLTAMNVKHTTENLTVRENDIIWRIRAKGEWLYLIFLLELQTTVDEFMAIRILTYSGLIYQDLLKNKKQNLSKANYHPFFLLSFIRVKGHGKHLIQ